MVFSGAINYNKPNNMFILNILQIKMKTAKKQPIIFSFIKFV